MTDKELIEGLIEAIKEDTSLMIKVEHKGLFITIHQGSITTVVNDADLRYAIKDFIITRKERKRYAREKELSRR